MSLQQTIAEYKKVNRKFESFYFPKVKKAIASKKRDVIVKLQNGGINYAMSYLHQDIGNEKLKEVIESLYTTVGLRHARMNYSRMTADIQKKGFGFNEVWTNYIINYFRRFLLEKITYNVAATTRDALLSILATATTEGWSVDQTVDKVEGWPERYQAARVVRTEVNRAANVGGKANSETLEYQQLKEWVSAEDNRVRGKKPKDHANHVKLNGTKIDAEDYFTDSVNGDKLDFPGDIKASAASVANCRCQAVYSAKRDANGNLIPKRRSTSVIYPGGIPRRRVITV